MPGLSRNAGKVELFVNMAPIKAAPGDKATGSGC